MQIGIDQLWVVVYRSQATSMDTDMPDEVFTTRESAEAFCAEINATPGWLRNSAFQVVTLAARLDELRSLLLRSVCNDQ